MSSYVDTLTHQNDELREQGMDNRFIQLENSRQDDGGDKEDDNRDENQNGGTGPRILGN